MRRVGRYRRKKQKKVLIIGSLSLFLCLCVGYAAFSTQLSLTAKGNIKDYNAAWQLKNNIVTTGDGLYLDEYESGRYIYRGQNPDNYIVFNDELWRIISVESDDTLKIILDSDRLGYKSWDSSTNRNNESNTYCNRQFSYQDFIQYWGCSVWAGVDGIYNDGEYEGTVTMDATLNHYLNSEFYDSLNSDKKYIVSHNFNIGMWNGTDDSIYDIYLSEKFNIWYGKLGLLSASDFLKASSNKNCNSYFSSRYTDACIFENGNYLDKFKKESWTINAYKSTTNNLHTASIRTFGAYFNDKKGALSGSYSSALYLVRPVVYLINDIKLDGNGTEIDPYKIHNSLS